LAKQRCKDRADQSGLPGTVLPNKRNKAGAQRLEIHADRAGKSFRNTAQGNLMDFHDFTPRK
jgi:hypothetical protein